MSIIIWFVVGRARWNDRSPIGLDDQAREHLDCFGDLMLAKSAF